jgi:hypothetical protein
MPEGKVTQMRMILDLDGENVARIADADCDLDVSRIDERGVKVNHVFKAFGSWDGNHQDIYLHFDLERSLTETADCYALEPHLMLSKVKIDNREHKL